MHESSFRSNRGSSPRSLNQDPHIPVWHPADPEVVEAVLDEWRYVDEPWSLARASILFGLNEQDCCPSLGKA